MDPVEIVGGLAIGEGLGGAISDTVTPRLQNFKNKQWVAHQDVPLPAGTAAQVAAERVDLKSLMETEASYTGYDATRFENLYGLALNAPGTGLLLELLRRNGEVAIDFDHGLGKGRLEPQWFDALRNLRDVRIPAPDLAYMVVRNLVPDPFGFDGPTSPDDTAISDIPLLEIDTLAEAAKTGWDRTRFEALVGRSGLAPAPVFAANAFFRNIITYEQFKTIIAKGDLRPAYTNVILNASRVIPTVHDYAEHHLRGWTDLAGLNAGAARHGTTPEDALVVFQNLGRPLNVHAVVQALARGGTFGGNYEGVPEPFLTALRQSAIRPEWGNLAYHARYSYSVPFWWRSMAQANAFGTIDPEQILLNLGNPPEFAKLVTAHFVGTGTAAADPHVTKAQTKAWTEAQNSYIAQESTAADVQPIFTTLGLDATATTQVLAVWDEVRALRRKQLSPKEIAKAYSESVINPATGVAWTQADAIAALLARGYDQADATVLLEL